MCKPWGNFCGLLIKAELYNVNLNLSLLQLVYKESFIYLPLSHIKQQKSKKEPTTMHSKNCTRKNENIKKGWKYFRLVAIFYTLSLKLHNESSRKSWVKWTFSLTWRYMYIVCTRFSFVWCLYYTKGTVYWDKNLPLQIILYASLF